MLRYYKIAHIGTRIAVANNGSSSLGHMNPLPERDGYVRWRKSYIGHGSRVILQRLLLVKLPIEMSNVLLGIMFGARMVTLLCVRPAVH